MKRELCGSNNTTFINNNILYTFEIREYGYAGAANYDSTGEEYNPLREVDKYGRQNPYQDPNRGTIGPITTDNTGNSCENGNSGYENGYAG